MRIDTKKLAGLLQEQAERIIVIAGGEPRVVTLEGIPQVAERDMRLNRVNMEIRSGRVVRAYVG